MMLRVCTAELMDDPLLDGDAHHAALRGLARLNRWSNSAGILWPALMRASHEVDDRPLRVLDIATGGGDVPRELCRRAARAGFAMTVHACDISQRATEHARSLSLDYPNLTFFQRNVLCDGVEEQYDVVCCSLFLHHLSVDDGIALLRVMRTAATRIVLVNDLARSRLGLALAHAAGRCLTRSSVVHTDAPRSVRAAYTRGEVTDMATRAGLAGATVRPRWPFRWLLTWSAL